MDKNNNNMSSRGGKDSSADQNSSLSGSNKRKRTVNVTAGDGPPQTMTPEDAAKFIQEVTSSRNATGQPKEVKISFGKGRSEGTSSGPTASFSFGSLDFAALAKAGDFSGATAAAAAAAAAASGRSSMSSSSAKGKDGLPCSEAEMKALMSMFVEIMGMSMDPDKLGGGSSSTKKKSNGTSTTATSSSSSSSVFMFGSSSSGGGPPQTPSGWPDAATAAAVAAGIFPGADSAAWESLYPSYDYDDDDDDDDDEDDDDDDDDDDSVTDFNGMLPPHNGRFGHPLKSALKQPSKLIQTTKASAASTGSTNGESAAASKEKKEIAPAEWDSLEKVALEDALEEEDKKKKAQKKREKKQRKKEKAKKDAAEKAAEAAQKKREKTILSWRSRVVSACQSNEVSKLEALLSESPLRPVTGSRRPLEEPLEDEEDDDMNSHLEFLLPNCIAKSRQTVERGRETREALAAFILSASLPLVFAPGRNGRTPLHNACFVGDFYFVRQVLGQASDASKESDSPLPENYLNVTCEDSGFAPLHYATVSGSKDVVETLLASGCDVKVCTDETHTWRASDGEGVTARELAELIVKGKHDKVLETHGNAIQEVITQFMPTPAERNAFLGLLQGLIQRLTKVEQSGYREPREIDYVVSEHNNREVHAISESNGDDLNGKKKTKKKKKKATQHQEESNSNSGEFVEPSADSKDFKDDAPEDPLVVALQNMGFTLEQILAAAKACGGLERATADDLVAWIFGQQSGDAVASISTTEPAQQEVETKSRPEQPPKVDAKAKAEAKLRDEAAKRQEEARIAAQRLAAKREETRRRNREWNNREQARQQEEAQAKLSAQAILRAQAEAHTALNVTPASLLLPQSIESAEKSTFTSIPPPLPPVHSAPKPAPIAGPPGVSGFVQPTRILKNPASIRPPNTRAVSLPTSPVPASMIAEKRNPDPLSVPIMGVESLSLYNDYPEDATVSSYGSGVRSVASMPKQFQMHHPLVGQPMPQPFLVPPGLRPATAKASTEIDMNTTSVPSYLIDPSLGDLRATAKSFTPSTFRPNASPVANLHMGGPSPLYPATAPLAMAPPPAMNSMPLSGGKTTPAFDGYGLRDPVSSLLTGPMLRPPGNPSMLTTPLQRGMANSFERGTNITPSTIHSDSTSSVSRISSYDEPPRPAPRSFGIDNHKLPTAPVGGPSILDSLELAPSSSSFGSGFAPRDLGSATIWGSGDTVGGSSTAPVAGHSLVGLPPLFLGNSKSHGVGGSDNRRPSNMEGAGVWESSLGGSSNSGGPSIW